MRIRFKDMSLKEMMNVMREAVGVILCFAMFLVVRWTFGFEVAVGISIAAAYGKATIARPMV